MPNSDLLPSLLYKINENQLALEAAIIQTFHQPPQIEHRKKLAASFCS
ncbi:hypothetical protein [Pseudomonas sp. Irchel s3a18]|nr:hypothetical protein [Pseudomonas sp. Irchel s3a18]